MAALSGAPAMVEALAPALHADWAAGDDEASAAPADAFDADDTGFASSDEPLALDSAALPEAASGSTRDTATAALDDAALQALLQRVATQDDAALEALYDATHARVFALAQRITQRPALAEEVVEDTFWQVWRQAARFDAARGRPITWLLAMARTRAIDALRRDQRFQHEEMPDEDHAEAAAACTVAPPEILDATRGASRLHAALAALDARSRQLVSLAFLRGLTHDEIAQQQSLPLGTVKSLIRRALQQMRGTLEAAA